MSSKGGIFVNCDGGLGNRINSLILARALHARGLPVIVNWPINSWCQASYSKVFEPDDIQVASFPLSTLSQVINRGECFFHDDISSKILGRDFKSVYNFTDLNDFDRYFNNQEYNTLLYPALIPHWLTEKEVTEAASRLTFKESIIQRALKFSQCHLGESFYGIHLRRTDLNLPPSDLEVDFLISSNPNQTFLICTDNSDTAAHFQAHTNVRLAPKTEFAKKRSDFGDWNMAMTDDYGRLYGSNIIRSEASVIDAAVDLLLLSQSTILAFRRSTFVSIARLLRPTLKSRSTISELATPNFFHFLDYLENDHPLEFSLEDVSNFACHLIKAGHIKEFLSYIKKLRNLKDSRLKNLLIRNFLILLSQTEGQDEKLKNILPEMLRYEDIVRALKTS